MRNNEKKKKHPARKATTRRIPHQILVIVMLALIDSEKGMTQSRLKERLGVSIPTVARFLRFAREEFQVQIEWTGEGFAIIDWGLFAGPDKLKQWGRSILKQLNTSPRSKR